MEHKVARGSIESLHSIRRDARSLLRWEPVFVLPQWLEAWWNAFGSGAEQYVCTVAEDGDVIGIAPLMVRDGTASFIGTADVCDYLDFVVVPGKERAFCSALLDRLRDDSVGDLHLESLRPDSVAFSHLAELARSRGHRVDCRLEDVSLDVGLPPTWEEYLDLLTPKQRREVGRKLRRLHEAGEIEFETVRGPDGVPDTMSVLLQLLRDSRPDKAAFMTAEMESFFRAIARTMAGAGLLRLGVLRIHSLPVAAVMCFDYNDSVYLYNSGYDPTHSYLSVGLLSKVLSLKDSIDAGRKTYDFLKGAEEYKYRLGGSEIPIYSCHIALG
jgi:CelD/BcsL family acetyltransferase involved in cellulose biosynthesis